MPGKLLTKQEAADYLGMPEKELDKLIAKGRLPAYKIGGSFLRFRQEQIEAVKKGIASPAKALNQRQPTPRRPSGNAGVFNNVADFLYFGDFYIVSFLIIITLIFIIVYF